MGKVFTEPTLGLNIQQMQDDIRDLKNAMRAMNLPLLTALPPNPYDGQTILFLGAKPTDTKSGLIWTLRYNQSSPYAYKWDFIGGSDLVVPSTGSSVSSGGTSYATGTQVAGVSAVLPLAGDYDSLFTARLYSQGNTAGAAITAGIGDSGTQIGGQIDSYQGSVGTVTTLFAAGQTKQVLFTRSSPAIISMRIWANAGNAVADTAELRIRPVRLG